MLIRYSIFNVHSGFPVRLVKPAQYKRSMASLRRLSYLTTSVSRLSSIDFIFF